MLVCVPVYGSNVICGGNPVTLNVPTVAGLTYQWQLNGANIIGQTSNTIQAVSAGSYTLFVVNGSGCTATSNAIIVTSAATPTVSISSASTTICGTGSISISTTAQAGSTYQWRRNGINISGATSASYSASQSGSYELVLTNSSGCSAISNTIDIEQVSSLTASIGASGNTTICQGSSSILSINTEPGNAIQWKLNNNNISGATGSTSEIIKSVGPLKRPLYLVTSDSDFEPLIPLSIALSDKLFFTTFALAPDLRSSLRNLVN